MRFDRTGCARWWSTWISVFVDRSDPSLRCHDSLAVNLPSVCMFPPVAVLHVPALWSCVPDRYVAYVDNGMASISAPVSGRNFTSCRPPLMLAPVIPTHTDITPALIAPRPDTSTLTQALQNMAISSSSLSQIAPSIQYMTPLAPSLTPPILTTRQTHPHHLLPAVPSPLTQSQARSLPLTDTAISPTHSHTASPLVKRTHINAPLSQCHSPKPSTGATRKRRLIGNQHLSQDIFSHMAKRLRSSKTFK